MRFLLIAPGRAAVGLDALTTAIEAVEAAGGGPDSAAGMLQSQLDHRTYLLTHLHSDLDVTSTDRVGRGAAQSLALRGARVHKLLGYGVLVADVEAEFAPGASGDLIERALSGIAADIAAASGDADLSELRWVGRYRILGDGEPAVAGWEGSASTRLPLRADGSATLDTGWANGTLRGWDALDAGERWDVIRGLVDAQVLWCQLEDIHQQSRLELRELYLSPSRAHLSVKVAALTDLNAWLQVHQLCIGDLVSATQGRRREVALATLDGWQFDDLRERTTSDIAAALVHTEALQRLRSQRYERAVEFVLLALTLVSTFGLVLSFISVAFINVTTHRPDDGAVDIPFVGLFRDIDADAVLLASGLVLVSVVVALLLSRRRSRPRVGR